MKLVTKITAQLQNSRPGKPERYRFVVDFTPGHVSTRSYHTFPSAHAAIQAGLKSFSPNCWAPGCEPK